MSIAEYMKALDPSYGAQQHQRDYVARMERVQATHPCARDHSSDDPPTHVTKCYPADQHGRMVGTW